MIDNQEVVKEQDERKIFANLIQYAEEYIKENAFDFLKLKSKKKYDTVRELIQDRYKPTHNIFDEQGEIIQDAEDKIIERLCIQLQNYQARPIVINYKSFDYVDKDGKKSNTILDIFKEYLGKYKENKCDENKPNVDVQDIYNALLDAGKFDEEKDTPDKAKKYIHKNKYNYVWYVYARGLFDCIEYLNTSKTINKETYDDGFKVIQKYILPNIKTVKESKTINKIHLKINFYDKIYYLGKALTYDFFKELGCTNLVKPDVHIIQLFKSCGFVKEEDAREDTVFNKFLDLCKDYDDQLTPYYIDKILWLCCTGAFYEDGIIVTNMTRNNFIKFIDSKEKQNET